MHLGARAQGGSGLIMTESAAVAPEGLTTPQDTDMWNDEQQAVWTGSSSSATARVPRWRSSWPTPDAMPRCIAAAPASHKATSSRLTRAGRRWDRRLSPTPVRPVPHALTIEEIGGVVQAFVDAARRSDRAGSTSLRFTPPMAICCTSSSCRCRICAPTGTGVISPGGPGYQVPFARSVPGGRSQDRRGGDAGWAASG